MGSGNTMRRIYTLAAGLAIAAGILIAIAAAAYQLAAWIAH